MLRLVVVILVCLALLSGTESRKSTSSSRRGSSRGGNNKNYGNGAPGTGQAATSQQSNGGFFGSWFSGSSSSGGASATAKKDTGGSTYGWSNPSNAKVQTNGWSNPGYSPGSNVAPKPGQTNYGWTNPSHNTGQNTNFQPKPNGPPSSNIGPGGYPVQGGMNYGGHNTGYNRGAGYNQHPPGYNPIPPNNQFQAPVYGQGYTGAGLGSYPAAQYSPNTHAAQHGFTNNNYPQHSMFGYPGQGMFDNSARTGARGLGIFGGGRGSYGYPQGGNWGVPSYGGQRMGGGGTMLKSLAVGAVGGVVASTLISGLRRDPWNYNAGGYGDRHGYQTGYQTWNRDQYDRSLTTTTPAPRPEDNWVHCVAFDPTTNTTLINPNCSCTVTTSVDPATGLPISSHFCTNQAGVVPQPQFPYQDPLPPQQPMMGVNDPNAAPSYLNNYNPGQGYGGFGGGGYYVPPVSPDVSPETSTAEIVTTTAATAPAEEQTTTEAAAATTTEDPYKDDVVIED